MEVAPEVEENSSSVATSEVEADMSTNKKVAPGERAKSTPVVNSEITKSADKSSDKPKESSRTVNKKFDKSKPSNTPAKSSKKDTGEKVNEPSTKSESSQNWTKKKKKVVMIPDGDKSKGAVSSTSHGKGAKKPKNNSAQNGFKGKIRGENIDYFVSGAHDSRKRKRKDKRKKHEPVVQANPTKAIKKIIKVEGTITVSELAKRMGQKSSAVIKKMMEMGEMVGLNDRVDFDMASILAGEFDFQAENVAMDEAFYVEPTEDSEDSLIARPPVVTVMGHVDHGKTKLLDTIRHTNVVDREAGGITQHIGAYTVNVNGQSITFLDTPGHEAFTAMRSRGVQATDVVILIVAADDGVMPQTAEAINHAKAAKVPIIVAINKIDKPDSNPEKVRQELLKYEILPEEWGGDNFFVEISAKQNLHIDKLLETILLQVEMMELRANPNKRAVGIVVESRMDQGRGPVATTLVKEGTLNVGDLVVVGSSMGYVRAMTNWKGEKLKEASLSMAVEITGLDSVPQAGEKLFVMTDEKKAKGLSDMRKNDAKAEKLEKQKKLTLDNLFSTIKEGEMQDLNVIIKADVDGSVEAISSSLKKIEHEKIRVRIIHSAVGGITENDILLASASNAILVGFNVRADNKARLTAASESVDVRIYSIIYDLINSVKSAMTGRLAPIVTEEYTGKAEVRQTFKVPKIGTIAGCMVLEGKLIRDSKIKVIRDNIVVYEGLFNSLKRYKDDVKEVKGGYECGLGIEGYNDLQIEDLIECYINKETADEVK